MSIRGFIVLKCLVIALLFDNRIALVSPTLRRNAAIRTFRMFSTKRSGVGFGKPNASIGSSSSESKSKIAEVVEVTSPQTQTSQSIINQQVQTSSPISSRDVDSIIQETEMFKSKRQLREAILDEKIQKIRDEDELMASDPSVGAVPELVANRMLGRIITFFGIPVFGGLSIFVAAYFVSKKYDITVPPMVIAYATQVPFIIGLIGISYAILSSSWDEEEGSALGLAEFKTNFKRIQEGLSRTRETAALREDVEREADLLGRSRK